MRPRVVVAWSTGKDSAWCLHRLRADATADVVGILTTVTAAFERVSVHGTRRSVLHAQAAALHLPLREVEIPYPCTNAQYERAMGAATETMAKEEGITHVAFGDLFLEDVRAYRERRLDGTGIAPLFPLWGSDTAALAGEMAEAGLRAVIVSAPESSPATPLVGTWWTPEAVAGLDGVDPCGERGEFHTCVVEGPGLWRLDVEVGSVVTRDGAVYADVRVPA